MFQKVSVPFQITEFFHKVFDRRFSKDFTFDGEKHDFYEVVYVLEGMIEVTEDEKVYKLGERDIIFHAPNEFHRIRSDQSSSPHVLNVSFKINGDLPQGLKSGVMHLSSAFHEEYVKTVSRLADELSKNVDNSPELFEISCRLSALFLRLSQEIKVKDSLCASAGAKTYSAVVEMMQREVKCNLCVEDFAKANYISASYLKKLFSYYAGISPKKYYHNLRTSEAERLLLSGTTVSEISEVMNFSSPAYFTIFFKKQTGLTPTGYRKKYGI